MEEPMKGAEDVESYLIQMEAEHEPIGDNVWVVKSGGADLVLSIADNVVVYRVKVMNLDQVPKTKREELYQTLLELNAAEMLHGAYGLEGDAVVATAALQLENLDFNEFQAAIDDLGLSVSNHYPTLSSLAA
jgi:hypothetical protein